jgi:hypothetical protein
MTTDKPLQHPAHSPAAREPLWRLIFGLPHTPAGWSAVLFGLAACGLYVLFWALIATGQQGGDAFFANPLLAATLLLADAASLVAGGTAMSALTRRGERSLPVLLTVVLAIATLVFVAGTIVGP